MNIFSKIFNRPAPEPKTERVEMMGSNTRFTAWSGDAYSNDIYRGAVDAVARNAGKLKPSHVVTYRGNERFPGDSRLNRILQVQPNPYMNAYDLLYKLVTHYYLYNNAFAFINRDDRGEITGIFPIRATSADFLADPIGNLYCEFSFMNGKKHLLPYSDIIHIKRNFNDNDLLGDDNSAINAALELAHTQNQGLVTGIKTGVTIRGLLTFKNILNEEILKEKRDAFMADYMQLENSGGVAAVDNSVEYVPIENKPYVIDSELVKATRDKIYNYLGVTEPIVSSSYNEDQWAAFYESTIEPIALQLSLEFTRKIFTEREQAFGNSILFESGRLQFTSNQSKVELLKEIMPMGLLTVNQALEILNLPSVENGDRRIQSLNYVDQALAADYQLNSKTNPVKTPKEDGEPE